MKHAISHELDQATAKRVVEHAFAAYEKRFPAYEPTLRWRGDQRADVTFSVKGVKLSGEFALQEKRIELQLDVPLLLRPFQSRALEVIESEVRVWLEKARAGTI